MSSIQLQSVVASFFAVTALGHTADSPVKFVVHRIGEVRSEAVGVADFNGDGTPDLITGKRFMAHNGSDPDESGKLGVYWYEFQRGADPKWTKHAISFDQGIGSGVNLCAADLDKDGDMDVVVTGKRGGPVWFENVSVNNTAQ